MLEHNQVLYKRIKLISNKQRFAILEATEKNSLTITKLSSKLKLAYNKCADYVSLLEKAGLIEKTKLGKEVKIESKVKLNKDKVEFPQRIN